MTDVREDTLSALFAVLEGVDLASVKVYRNRTAVSEAQRPAIVLLDGDEEAREMPFKSAKVPNIVTMEPVVLLFCTSADSPGPTVNEMRAAVIKAVCMDDTIKAVTGIHSKQQYVRGESGFRYSEATDANMALTFSLSYVLNPAVL